MTLSMGSVPLPVILLRAVNAVLAEHSPMKTPSIDSLINQLVPLRSSGSGPVSAGNTAVIEAVVLSSSPLLRSDNSTQYQVTVASHQQRYELTTQTPIPTGAIVQLRIAQNNMAVLLAINSVKVANNPATLSPTGAETKLQLTAALSTNAITQARGAAVANLLAETNLLRPADPQQTNRQLIAETVRQALPQQQPLRTLLPLLVTALQQPQALPKPLLISLQHLMKQFPSAEQLQQVKPLKQAIQNSGVFFESKLAERLRTPGNPADSMATSPRPFTNPNTPINQDIKGLIERLLPQIQQAAQTTPGSSGKTTDTSVVPPTAVPPTIAPSVIAPTIEALTDPHAHTMGKGKHSPEHSPQQNLDVLLRQLSRQLLATLARTQLHQMESLGHRQLIAADPQAPVNSWHLEIPILHGQHVDNLELQIEEHQQSENREQAAAKKQWLVTLNFDLHQLGKMQVQLTIADRDVSAVVWSQLRETHDQVKRHIRELQTGLEAVGVKVKNVECQLGAAPRRASPLYQQLLDVRT